jgi:hypothetical protein
MTLYDVCSRHGVVKYANKQAANLVTLCTGAFISIPPHMYVVILDFSFGTMEHSYLDVRFEVFKAMRVQIVVFRVTDLGTLVLEYQRFGGTCRLNFQCRNEQCYRGTSSYRIGPGSTGRLANHNHGSERWNGTPSGKIGMKDRNMVLFRALGSYRVKSKQGKQPFSVPPGRKDWSRGSAVSSLKRNFFHSLRVAWKPILSVHVVWLELDLSRVPDDPVHTSEFLGHDTGVIKLDPITQADANFSDHTARYGDGPLWPEQPVCTM